MERVSQKACASGEKKRGGKRRCNKEKRPIEKRSTYEDLKDLKVTEEVLKSDEKLWALYEQWCSILKPYLSAEQKQTRFPFFKKCASVVYKLNQNKKNGGCAGLNCWADETDNERLKRCGSSSNFYLQMRLA